MSASNLADFVAALHRFCDDLSEAIVRAGEEQRLDDVEGIQDAIRDTIANLTLADYECGRILNRV